MIKVGVVGARAESFFSAFAARDDAEVTAVCDLDEEIVESIGDRLGLPKESRFRIYEDMLDRADIDAVLIATPMQCHVPQAIKALQSGRHVMSEVTAAVTMDELWWLIEAVEKSGKIYMYSENYCYTPEMQIVKAMAHSGLFGKIYYAEGEYTHDCTDLRLWHGKVGWRSYWQMGTRGAFYPTHSLGPVMQCLDDDERITEIACFSSGNHNPYGLRNDDVNQVMCRLKSGGLVKIRVDTISPRPHCLYYYQIQGTNGCFEAPRTGGDYVVAVDTPEKPEGHMNWTSLNDFRDLLPERYKSGAGDGAGHGGGDYYIVDDFVTAIKKNELPYLNVYRAAEWTAVALLSQLSVTNNGRAIEMPNFRPGMPWEEKRIKL